MTTTKKLIQHVSPTLSAALGGPFAGVALKFIKDNIAGDDIDDGRSTEDIVKSLLDDSKNLQKIKDIDHEFKSEMQKLNVDVFSLEKANNIIPVISDDANRNPRILISTIFLVAYFLMLAAIFAVEASDSINMKSGDNSLMGELQILFGVLTAGVGQILSFWFGGVLGKNDSK